MFFSSARCPKDNVVGGLNNGWKVAMTTLGFERGSSATTSHRRFEKELDSIVETARHNGRIDDPSVRQALAKQWSKIQIMRINGYRTLTAAVHDKKDPAVAALGATNKMFWSETHRDTMNLAMDILGPYAQILTGKVDRRRRVRARLRAPPRPGRLPGVDPAGVVLLLPVRDDLGRYRRDPAQHRRRARPRPAEGAEAGR